MSAVKNSGIKSEKVVIRDIFSEKYWFSIPNYQRAYVWGEDEITELIDDINYASERNPCGEYFLGSMVLCKKSCKDETVDFDEYEVLDGQQRLTTLMLILACIRDRTQDDQLKDDCNKMLYQEHNKWKNIPARNRLIYDIRDGSTDFIDSFVKSCDATRSPTLSGYTGKTISQANMANGLKTIHKCFDDKKRFRESSVFDSFIQYLLNKALFIYVATENFEDAFRMFTILNDRGIPLANSDILKANNLSKIENDKDRAKWAHYWEEIEGDLGRDEFDRFLSLVRTIYVKDKAREGLLNEFNTRIYGTKPPLLELGTKTFSAVKEYKDAYDKVILLENMTGMLDYTYHNRINGMRRGLPSTDWIPPVLAWYKKFGMLHLIDILKKIDNKFSADWILQLTPTERISNMNDVLISIAHATAPEDVLSSPIFDFDSKSLMDLMGGAIYGRRFVRYVLLRLEYLVATNTVLLNLPDEISVEHILPQNPKPNSQWLTDFTDDQREECLHCVGNLMLLSRRKNASLGNLDFSSKRDRYFKDRVENLPNSLGVLVLPEYKFANFGSRHKELLDKLHTSYKS